MLLEKISCDNKKGAVFQEKLAESHKCLLAAREGEQKSEQKLRRMQTKLVSCHESGPSLDTVITAGLSFLSEVLR